jgi:DNA-binding transcriptional LysR family regulator
MEIQQLRHLMAAIQYGNLVRAADEMNMSQSGLSRSIKSLETRLGVPLLVRGPAGVIPTAFGLGLVGRARVILNEVERARAHLNEIEAGEIGEVAIGATHNYAHTILPEIISAFVSQHRRAKVHVVTASFPELVDGVKLGKLDFAVALVGPLEDDGDIEIETLGEAHSRVVARKEHPFAGHKGISVKKLSGARWAMLDSASLQSKFSAFFAERKLTTPPQALRTSSVVLLKQALQLMDVLTVLPLEMVRDELRAGDLVTIDCETPSENAAIGLISRANSPLSPQIAKLAGAVRSKIKAGF